MRSPTLALTDDELARLNRFLVSRMDPGRMREGANLGLTTLCDLDGFLTALVSGPVDMPLSKWLPLVWGDEEPEWSSVEERESIISLITRHHAWLDVTLATNPESFEPQFALRLDGGVPRLFVDWWCYGYMVCVYHNRAAWDFENPKVGALLGVIHAFTTKAGHVEMSRMDPATIEQLRDSIPEVARKLYMHWHGVPAPLSQSV